jgi:putative FmdB family regulatory protein
MPIYQYRCPHCTTEYQDFRYSQDRDLPRDCPECQTLLVRAFTPPSIPAPFPEGVNRATGKFVRSKHDLSEQLKAQSEANTIRTGFESNLIMVDPADAPAVHGVDPPENSTYNKREHRPDEVRWLT